MGAIALQLVCGSLPGRPEKFLILWRRPSIPPGQLHQLWNLDYSRANVRSCRDSRLISIAGYRDGANCVRLATELLTPCVEPDLPDSAQMLRSRTVALRAESFENYCARVRAGRVASGEALLAEPFRAPRVWICAAPASGNARSRIITIDGVKQPWFATAPPTYPST